MLTLSTHASATALGIAPKTLDNILVREARPFITAGQRGRRRRVTLELLELIAIALILRRDLGVALTGGLDLARRILRSPDRTVLIGSLGSMTFDVPRLRDALQQSINDALEGIAEPTRGRPRAR